MDYRTIGGTPLVTSAIGYGTWPIGGARYGATDDAAATRAIAASPRRWHHLLRHRALIR